MTGRERRERHAAPPTPAALLAAVPGSSSGHVVNISSVFITFGHVDAVNVTTFVTQKGNFGHDVCGKMTVGQPTPAVSPSAVPCSHSDHGVEG